MRVLQVIEDADDDQKMMRALKWMCFLPQALLRKPSRGGKSGWGLVAKRFNAVVVEDWGKLVMLWQKDVEKLLFPSTCPPDPYLTFLLLMAF